MRKAGRAPVERDPVSLPEVNPLVEVDKKFDATMKDRLSAAVERHEGYVEEHRESLENAEEELEDAEEALVQYEKRSAPDLDAVLTRILRHKNVAKVEEGGNPSSVSMVVTTHPLFAETRLKTGGKKKVRTLLGVYELHLRPGYLPSVRNLTLGKQANGSEYAHWAVSGGVTTSSTPCWGEFSTGMSKLVNSGDWYGLVDSTIQFLRSAGDAGAYRLQEEWRGARTLANAKVRKKPKLPPLSELVLMGKPSETAKVGDYLLGIDLVDDSNLRGLVGQVVETISRDKQLLQAIWTTEHGPLRWWVDYQNVRLLGSDLAEIAKEYPMLTLPDAYSIDPIFERLDALPDTTTLEELNAIIHEAVN